MADDARTELVELGRMDFAGCHHGPNTWCNHKVAEYVDALLAHPETVLHAIGADSFATLDGRTSYRWVTGPVPGSLPTTLEGD